MFSDSETKMLPLTQHTDLHVYNVYPLITPSLRNGQHTKIKVELFTNTFCIHNNNKSYNGHLSIIGKHDLMYKTEL